MAGKRSFNAVRFACGLLAILSVIALAVGIISALGGCAVGRNELTGEVVLGIKAGRLVETTEQLMVGAAQGLGGLLPPPFGDIALMGVSALVGHQSGARKGWDEKEQDDLKKKGTA